MLCIISYKLGWAGLVNCTATDLRPQQAEVGRMSQVRSLPSTLREKSTWTPKNFPPSNEKVQSQSLLAMSPSPLVLGTSQAKSLCVCDILSTQLRTVDHNHAKLTRCTIFNILANQACHSPIKIYCRFAAETISLSTVYYSKASYYGMVHVPKLMSCNPLYQIFCDECITWLIFCRYSKRGWH